MNVHELPMILFTVIAQLCVGTFIVLGVIQVFASRRHGQQVVERLTEPIVYVIGPALVVGLGASMFHMNDVFNVLNVFRHWDSSWLSREIIFGMAFAGLGFLFALMQWFGRGSFALRRVVALLTALAGIALVWSMAQIYATLEAVPAWHTPIVPIHFFATTILLGCLAAGFALMATDAVRRRTAEPADGTDAADGEPSDGGAVGGGPEQAPERGGGALATLVRSRARVINAPTTDAEWALTTRTLQWLSVVAAVVGAVVVISYALHISDLAGDPVGVQSAAVFSGGFFVARLVLLGVATVVIGLFAFRTASRSDREGSRLLTTLIGLALVMAFVAELMGRSLHYDSMFRVGI